MDITTKIIQYESDELTHKETIQLFSHLIENGLVWKLQGHYGRTAARLIESGIISKEGKILTS